MTRRSRAVAIAAVLALAGGAAWAVRAALTPAPLADVMTATVTTGDIEETVLASGTLKPVKLVAVGAQASGRIVALKAKLGDRVAKGDLIAEIDSLTQQNTLRTAVASLDDKRAQRTEKEATLANAEATLARHQLTFAQKASSRADYDTAETTVKTTRAQIAQLDAQIVEAEVEVETARVNLGYTRITAPIDGTVLAIVAQEGQTVNAVQSAPTIVVLGQLDTMTVRAEISEADIVKVRPGQDVWFTIMGEPERRFHATLQSIEPAPESIKSDSSFSTSTSSSSATSSSSSSSTSSAIYYIGVFDVPNPDGRLRTYMTAQVRIVLGAAAGVPLVPAAALGPKNPDGTRSVQVVGPDGAIEIRPVTVGLDNKATAEVRSGLRAGERVVTGRRSSEAAGQTRMGPPPPMGF
ncbi:efflux RND transporter periplasmic adaptor subunit [Rhodoplanes sp. TEM]|uniref:Efflux RND transporter periplasmic adaptor subunit n=1 Tax=Rhodoplanes tepidamans TaxID=200616 RepID=A0ABT5JIW3_RHOTP|nr:MULTISPECIES: efflux RND transporter periplasmic adaptor subunit [Rhodoplanes]MDC7789457.1 efflux RND transporter periplasmic adaptor subunit [Rhodoplanes tepidamans]MDC7986996.1 efflux RND transporter periplasmic adaptor subunit [Rhodoplanes sp. TEM]MDQ0359028.1 macrolide-specific efflux system membrane fusion protein [Rhodoplanes tepidamans]